MHVFLRYAAYTDHLPNRMFTKAYDARILFITSGEGEIRFSDRAEALFANSMVYYPAGTEYLPLPSAEAPPYFVTLNFDFDHSGEHIGSVMPPVASNEFKAELANESHLHCGISIYQTPFVLHHAKEFKEAFLEIVKAFSRGTPHAREAAQSLLQYVLCRISEQDLHPYEELYNRIVAYIAENLPDIESNAQIARAINYHPYYINQYFKSKSGKTLHKYVLEQRLQRSVALLRGGNESISTIAHNVGFKNADHFSKCFKAHYRTPPSDLHNKTKLV